MALIDCKECGKQVSDKAAACPHCGAPIEVQATAEDNEVMDKKQQKEAEKVVDTLAGKKPWKYRKLLINIATLVVIAAVVVIYFKVRSGSSLKGAITGPQVIVSEKIALKEGEAMGYSFFVPSPRRVEVEVEASPKAINVFLMSESEWKRFKDVKGSLLGGKYYYRKNLSRQSVLKWKKSDILPAGNWRIVVERPSESLVFTEDTTASVKITGY